MRHGSKPCCSSWNVWIQNKDTKRRLATGMPINVSKQIVPRWKWHTCTHHRQRGGRQTSMVNQVNWCGRQQGDVIPWLTSSALVTIIVGSQDFGGFRGLCISNERVLYLWHPCFSLTAELKTSDKSQMPNYKTLCVCVCVCLYLCVCVCPRIFHLHHRICVFFFFF